MVQLVFKSFLEFKTAISTDKAFHCLRRKKSMSSPECFKATTHHAPDIGKVRELYFPRTCNSCNIDFVPMHNQIKSLKLLVCNVSSTQTHEERYREYLSFLIVFLIVQLLERAYQFNSFMGSFIQ